MVFTESTLQDLGLNRHPVTALSADSDKWNNTSMAKTAASHRASVKWASSIYRGIVPANNLKQRDFAVNDAIIPLKCLRIGSLRISLATRCACPRPLRPEEAFTAAEVNAAWMRKRFPNDLLCANESYTGSVPIWSWPQAVDEILEDMELPSMRSGGNWLTWPLRATNIKEIATLKEERDTKRKADALALSSS
ncbi:hypothetical protein HGRIS_014855 [Hohenbuehelia grisea]|uniref:Uncharacterized protein n=1 Tax=Hohenbuehelia grisea TaxID=104357 RepID=A0ABR3IQY4_9AGAR